ncbi:hypothetical protein [Streptomyces sp. NPDC090080]|uniref:hypothetical protein n=1 Tax=Streptomyces sp. NPDC090080 TaxID=3365939 RepID=UPI0038054D3E
MRADLERVDVEMARLKGQLQTLANEREFLGKLWDSVQETALPEPSVPLPEASLPPVDAKTESDAGVTEPPRRSSVARSRRGALMQAVIGHLSESDKPMSVNDMSDALGETSPSTSAGKVVVRNTLEALVAKGVAQRKRDGASVYYTYISAAP